MGFRSENTLLFSSSVAPIVGFFNVSSFLFGGTCAILEKILQHGKENQQWN